MRIKNNKGERLIVCFSDKEKGKSPLTLEGPTDVELKKINEKGFGIFETANSFFATPEQLRELAIKKNKKIVTKRNKEFLLCLNEVFADMDVCNEKDGLIEEEREKRKIQLKEAIENYCPASTYVITKNGLQPRWWIEEPNIDEATQQKYVGVTNGIIEWSKQHGSKGDPVKDVTRVLRKPGYYHHKSEPYLVTEEGGNGKIYTLDELREYFWHESVIKKDSIKDEIYDPINSLDVRQVVIDVWKEKGHIASFDKEDRLIIDGVVTATFKGRLGGNFIATTSGDYPAKGNAITYVAETLGIDNKQAFRWMRERYNLKNNKNPTKVPIESIEEILNQIPRDISKVKIIETLEPIFKKLITLEKITAENFILYTIKDFFRLTKEDAKKYVTHLNILRKKTMQLKNEEKRKKEKLQLILDRDIDSREAYEAILEIGIIDEQTFKIITAVIISSKLRLNPPLWLFLIGVPSSFKTEFVGLFGATDEVYTLDTLSENAFSSGYVPMDGSEPQDLLPLLDNKAFIIKDLNTLFSMNEEMVKKILGDLTSIFDGKFEKFTATRGLVEYNSLFSMIGCITPSILIKHYNYAVQLGPRFLFIRVPELDKEEMNKSLDKFWNEKDRKNKIIKTRQIVSSYCAQQIAKIQRHENKAETHEIKTKINNIALFMCRARGVAISNKATFINESDKKIEYLEIKDQQIEQPWRILNQLKSLLRILSFINNKDTVGEEELQIIKSVILSTMPVDRAEVLGVLTKKCGLSCKELAKEIKKSTKTIQRTIKELEAVGIVDCYKDSNYNIAGKAPWLYYIKEEFATVLNAPIPTPECVSQSKSNTPDVVISNDEDDDWEF